jgi:gas vesicle protein
MVILTSFHSNIFNMKSKGKIAIITAGALAAGITIGLLFAPRKGTKTRKRIVCHMNELMERVNSTVSAKVNDGEDVEEKSKNIMADS